MALNSHFTGKIIHPRKSRIELKVLLWRQAARKGEGKLWFVQKNKNCARRAVAGGWWWVYIYLLYLWSPAYLPTEDDWCAWDCGNSPDLIYSANAPPTTALPPSPPTTPTTSNWSFSYFSYKLGLWWGVGFYYAKLWFTNHNMLFQLKGCSVFSTCQINSHKNYDEDAVYYATRLRCLLIRIWQTVGEMKGLEGSRGHGWLDLIRIF